MYALLKKRNNQFVVLSVKKITRKSDNECFFKEKRRTVSATVITLHDNQGLLSQVAENLINREPRIRLSKTEEVQSLSQRNEKLFGISNTETSQLELEFDPDPPVALSSQTQSIDETTGYPPNDIQVTSPTTINNDQAELQEHNKTGDLDIKNAKDESQKSPLGPRNTESFSETDRSKGDLEVEAELIPETQLTYQTAGSQFDRNKTAQKVPEDLSSQKSTSIEEFKKETESSQSSLDELKLREPQIPRSDDMISSSSKKDEFQKTNLNTHPDNRIKSIPNITVAETNEIVSVPTIEDGQAETNEHEEKHLDTENSKTETQKPVNRVNVDQSKTEGLELQKNLDTENSETEIEKETKSSQSAENELELSKSSMPKSNNMISSTPEPDEFKRATLNTHPHNQINSTPDPPVLVSSQTICVLTIDNGLAETENYEKEENVDTVNSKIGTVTEFLEKDDSIPLVAVIESQWNGWNLDTNIDTRVENAETFEEIFSQLDDPELNYSTEEMRLESGLINETFDVDSTKFISPKDMHMLSNDYELSFTEEEAISNADVLSARGVFHSTKISAVLSSSELPEVSISAESSSADKDFDISEEMRNHYSAGNSSLETETQCTEDSTTTQNLSGISNKASDLSPAILNAIDDCDLVAEAKHTKCKQNFCFYCKKLQTNISDIWKVNIDQKTR